MVHLTRLGGPVFALNPDLIERAEATPDTVVTLVNGSKYVICESLEELTDLIASFRARVIGSAHTADLHVVPTPAPHTPGHHSPAHHSPAHQGPGAADTTRKHPNNVLPLRGEH